LRNVIGTSSTPAARDVRERLRSFAYALLVYWCELCSDGVLLRCACASGAYSVVSCMQPMWLLRERVFASGGSASGCACAPLALPVGSCRSFQHARVFLPASHSEVTLRPEQGVIGGAKLRSRQKLACCQGCVGGRARAARCGRQGMCSDSLKQFRGSLISFYTQSAGVRLV
jgi:hypothetical protein